MTRAKTETANWIFVTATHAGECSWLAWGSYALMGFLLVGGSCGHWVDRTDGLGGGPPGGSLLCDGGRPPLRHRRAARRTLPSDVRGRASTTSTSFGADQAGSTARTQSRSSLSDG